MDIINSLFGSKKGIEFKIKLHNESDMNLYHLELVSGQSFDYPILSSRDEVSGVVKIRCPKGSRLEHTGITMKLIGSIIDYKNGAESIDFLTEEKLIEKPGIIMGKKSLKFSFKKGAKKYESYYGVNVRVRYYLRVEATKAFGPMLTEEKDLWIIRKDKEPTTNRDIKVDVGIEDCLHIEFQYDKEKYHLDDVITGTIHFVLAKIKINHMDIEIIQKEYCGKGEKEVVESETIAKFEIMDGMPVKDEIIPVRLYLKPYELTPTFDNVMKLFSVKYFLNLVLVDSNDCRFFKQQEIILWRKTDRPN